MNSKFFFFLRIEIDIFRHETNLTSETWQTFFFHFDSGPRMHVKRQNCIRWEAKKFSNKSVYGWNHDTSPVILTWAYGCCFDFNIATRDSVRFALPHGYPPQLEIRLTHRKICILFCNSGSFRSLGFTLFLSFLPCATSHFINMKVSWRRWNSKTSQSEISSPVKTNDTNDITSCHGMYVAIPFSLFSSLFSFSFSSGFFFFFAFLLILLYPIFHSLRWDFR